MNAREVWERNKQEIHDLLLPFVKQHQNAWQMKLQYERIERIVDGCSRLRRLGDVLLPEFVGGTEIKVACGISWDIALHTGFPVRFNFNGITISMGEASDERAQDDGR